MKKLLICNSFSLFIVLTQAVFYEFDLDNSESIILQGKVFELALGDELRLVMDENPTDGYNWSFT
jgi:predicted secreted protein